MQDNRCFCRLFGNVWAVWSHRKYAVVSFTCTEPPHSSPKHPFRAALSDATQIQTLPCKGIFPEWRSVRFCVQHRFLIAGIDLARIRLLMQIDSFEAVGLAGVFFEDQTAKAKPIMTHPARLALLLSPTGSTRYFFPFATTTVAQSLVISPLPAC